MLLCVQDVEIRDRLHDALEHLDEQRDRQVFEEAIADDLTLDHIPLEDWQALLMSISVETGVDFLSVAVDHVARATTARNMDFSGLAEHQFWLSRALKPIHGDRAREVDTSLKKLTAEWKKTDDDPTT
ncbi:hypothetical protein HNP40_002168 [Mycobacteroides chelonae]|nr:hypothetical protein [Mycobacteroides chelonae]